MSRSPPFDETRPFRWVLTVPNAITAARLLCAPGLLAFLLQRRIGLATALVAAAGITDFLDGFVARRLAQQSELERRLDPAADRAVMLAVEIGGLVSGALPVWVAVPLFVRDALVLGAVCLFGFARLAQLRTQWIGKVSTALVYVATSLFFLGRSLNLLAVTAAAWVAAVPATALYVLWLVPTFRAIRAVVIDRPASDGEEVLTDGPDPQVKGGHAQ